MNIAYEYKNFPPGIFGSASSGHGCYSSSLHDMVWAAVTVGRKNLHQVLRHGAYSWFEVMYRAYMIWANLKLDPLGNIQRTKAYDALDPSEKTAVSYFVGQSTAKLFASRFLKVPWLQHMSRFTNGVHVSPDLIGKRRGGGAASSWALVEAKGRTGRITSKVKSDAYSQAKRALALTHRGTPVTASVRVASVAHFKSTRLHVHWQDPVEDHEGETARIDIDEDEFMVAYYEPIASVVSGGRLPVEERNLGNRFVRLARIPELDLAIGLDIRILERVRAASAAGAHKAILEITEQPAPSHGADEVLASSGDGSAFVYGDGVAVELGHSWQPEIMRLEPENRPGSRG